MPYKGHKTITVTEDLLTRMEEIYFNDIVNYRTMGLKSFAKFVQYYLSEKMDELIQEKAKNPRLSTHKD